MCYSAPASFTALIISVGIAIWLWNRNRKYDRWNALFIISFAMIQLWEGLIWMGYDSSVMVSLILLTLLTQPLAQSYGGWKTLHNPSLEWMFYGYVMLLIYGFYLVSTRGHYSSVGKHGHLKWNSFTSEKRSGLFPGMIGIVYLIGLFLPLLFAWREMWPLLIVGGLTAYYSMISSSSGEFGSKWCYFAVIYSITAIFIS